MFGSTALYVLLFLGPLCAIVNRKTWMVRTLQRIDGANETEAQTLRQLSHKIEVRRCFHAMEALRRGWSSVS